MNNIEEEAKTYLESNKKKLIQDFVISKRLKAAENPISFFMAGATGAGKTEMASNLVGLVNNYLHIDADKIREWIPGYNGANATDFQSACSLGVEKIYDYCLEKKFNVIVDGTLQSYNVATKNITRSLLHGRKIVIFFVYQEPVITWSLVKIRERLQGRKVPFDVFVKSYLESIRNVDRLKREYGDRIELWCLEKRGKTDEPGYEQKIYTNVGSIDSCLKVDYNIDSVQEW